MYVSRCLSLHVWRIITAEHTGDWGVLEMWVEFDVRIVCGLEVWYAVVLGLGVLL
jgi:hypothetical protein